MLKTNRMQRFMIANTSVEWISLVLEIKIEFQCLFPGFEKKTCQWPATLQQQRRTIEPCFFN